MPLLSRGGSSSVLLFGGRSGGLIGRPGAGAARIGGAAPAGRGALDRIDLRPEILGPEGVAEYRRFLRQLPAHRVILYDRAGIVVEETGRAPGRGRVGPYTLVSGGAGSIKKKIT